MPKHSASNVCTYYIYIYFLEYTPIQIHFLTYSTVTKHLEYKLTENMPIDIHSNVNNKGF